MAIRKKYISDLPTAFQRPEDLSRPIVIAKPYDEDKVTGLIRRIAKMLTGD